ncbi:MAG: CHASE2 domain-containing protein [Phormidesmis sp.]
MNWVSLRSKVHNLFLEGRLGLGIISVIVGLRLSGSLQFLELLTLDKFQQLKLGERPDSRITLIGIDDSYLASKSNSSLAYADLAKLLETVMYYQPAVVGVDLVEDDLSGSGKPRLLELFKNNNNLLSVEKIRPPIIPPLEGLSKTALSDRVGFNDFSLDNDGSIRRMFLGWTPTKPENAPFRKSFSLMLAEQYLKTTRGIEIENGIRDEGAMQFDTVEIPRLKPTSGGYREETSIYGIQTLINFRGGLISARAKTKPFKILLASELTQGNFESKDISDKIVVIGSLDPANATKFNSLVPRQLTFNNERLTGLELQAHATSQITSAVLDRRPLIWSLHPTWGYAFIVVFGLMGVGIKRLSKSTFRGFTYLFFISFFLIFISYWGLFSGGLWLPIVPVLLALTLNGFTYIVVAQSENRWQALVQERDRALAAIKLERQRTIEHAFDTIHNGPLQTLANLLRLIRDDQITSHDTGLELKKLNQEIREIGETLRKESISDETLYIQVEKSRLDLNMPLHELFYEIYRETLERPFPGFQTLKIQARSLEPIEPENLTIECKRKLCRFFEETLCNVGRHAVGATKLTVTGKTIQQFYCLRIIDNGLGLQPRKARRGQGTKIAHELEIVLKGKFTRRSNYPKGVSCELKWALI